jgi:membrane protein YdbS with pleckstrin-like domain
VQQIQINQNLYQRAHNLATLHFITAGGNVELPYIKYATAKQLTDYALYEIESKNELWM